LQPLAKNFTVLYVEDDIFVQKMMTKYLRKLFLDVTTANDGLDGLSTYKSKKFDIVITDLSMPKMDGIEMLEKIRELNQDQAILITTAHNEPNYMIRAIKIGVDGYIIKPFDYNQLNYELYKISDKLKKFSENEMYKKQLERMVDQKTSELNALINFQKDNYEKTLLSMVEMIEERDTYTAGHSQRVAKYSKMIAKEMGLGEDECNKLYRAGILHDIGKVVTPDVVLLKPQKLNDLEYRLIKEHVSIGYKLLVNVPMFKELAEIMYDHHERCDGSGYPRGIKADEINPLAKIMMIADAFDAMTTNRIYKGRKNIQEAFDEILSLKGVKYDSNVVDAAIKALKDVIIDQNINQLPHTDIEKERFAYFYKDSLTNLYNQSYLDVILVQNSYELKYSKLYLVKLKKFSMHNEKNGWKSGDDILKKIAESLQVCIKEPVIFRVFGDDFAILDNDECKIAKAKVNLDTVLKDTVIEPEIISLSLLDEKVKSVEDLEKL
jgi:putative nucleotidyltransferase with HDIG domain